MIRIGDERAVVDAINDAIEIEIAVGDSATTHSRIDLERIVRT